MYSSVFLYFIVRATGQVELLPWNCHQESAVKIPGKLHEQVTVLPRNRQILGFIIPLLHHFTILRPDSQVNHIRAKERAKYATLLHCRTGQKYGRTTNLRNTDLNLVEEPLFHGLTKYTSGHFAHCSQLAKYPGVLYVKPSNKVHLLHY